MSAKGEVSKEVTDWNKLAVAQLKGALARRGLNSDGVKEELVRRLQEYDNSEGLSSMETEEEKEEQETTPMLLRSNLKIGVGIVMSLKTVVINPFKPEMMQDSTFISWVETCKSYSFKKTLSGVSAAQLFFDSIDKGGAALTDLKANIQRDDVEIYHPRHYHKNSTIEIPSDFEELTDEQKPSVFLWERLIVLENLPDLLNTEEKLSEFFPEALQAVSFKFDPAAKGIAILEFATEQDADNYMKTVGDEVKLEDADIKVTKYSERNNDWHKVGGKEKPKDLDTDERVALNRELTQLRNDLDSIHQSDDFFGQDKLVKMWKQQNKVRDAANVLRSDTVRRLQKELTIPEEEEEMQENTKVIIAKKKGEVTKGNEEAFLNNLADLDKKLLAVEKEYMSLSAAIKSNEKLLSEDKKKERSEKIKNRPTLTLTQNLFANKKKQQLIQKARIRSKFNKQRPSANLLKSFKNQSNKRSRPGGEPNTYDMDEPPFKKQQMNQRRQMNKNKQQMNQPMNQRKQQMNRGKQQMNRGKQQMNQGKQQMNRGNQQMKRGNQQRNQQMNQRNPQRNQQMNQRNQQRNQQMNPRNQQRNQQMNPRNQQMNPRNQQMNQRNQPMNRSKQQMNQNRPNKNFGTGGMRGSGGYGGASGGGQGGYRNNTGMRGNQNMRGGSDNSMGLIEGITSALTDKMMQLEQMQKQTLQTQTALFNQPQGGASGFGNSGFDARAPLGGGMGSSSNGSGLFGPIGGNFSSNQNTDFSSNQNYSDNRGNYGSSGSGYGSGNYGGGLGGGYGK